MKGNMTWSRQQMRCKTANIIILKWIKTYYVTDELIEFRWEAPWENCSANLMGHADFRVQFNARSNHPALSSVRVSTVEIARDWATQQRHCVPIVFGNSTCACGMRHALNSNRISWKIYDTCDHHITTCHFEHIRFPHAGSPFCCQHANY